ncbi:MAG: hypothetical protein DMF33_12520 [Verrucomicrobia bacterium]|nr:MAG: hypothetical protein DMF33_12520 [Verrucomicrobiota bacterium]
MLHESSAMKRTILYSVIALLFVRLVDADQTVQSVQQALKDQGFYYGNVTGDKSAETTSAIRRYQIRNGLQVTGDVDPETLRSLNVNSHSASLPQTTSNPAITHSNSSRPDENSKLAQTSSPAPSTERAQDRQIEPTQPFAVYNSAPPRISKRIALAEVQRQLMSRGYYQGSIDGRYGRRTAFAVRAFQLGSGMPPTGRLDPGTLNGLGLSSENLAYSEPTRGSYETWVPITKFKHGRWKVKWKKVHGDQRDEQAAERTDAWWNGYNQDE